MPCMSDFPNPPLVLQHQPSLLVQDTEDAPETLVKHQTNISELKRTFLEQGPDKSGLTEWEKRLSSSPLRSPRLDEAPMIEPLLPDEVSSHTHSCVLNGLGRH